LNWKLDRLALGGLVIIPDSVIGVKTTYEKGLVAERSAAWPSIAPGIMVFWPLIIGLTATRLVLAVKTRISPATLLADVTPVTGRLAPPAEIEPNLWMRDPELADG